jgi:thymidylate kinase
VHPPQLPRRCRLRLAEQQRSDLDTEMTVRVERTPRHAAAARSREVGPIHPLLTAAFAALDDASVGWCLLRFPESLAAPTGDIDMLVAPADLRTLVDLLTDQGFVELPRFDRSHSFVRYDATADVWIWLDVATELAFGDPPLQTGAEEECLSRRQRVGGAWLLEASDRFWMLVLRAALDHRSMTAAHRARLQAAAEQTPHMTGALAGLVRERLSSSWSAAEFVQAVKDGDWARIDGALRQIREADGGPIRKRLRRAPAIVHDLPRRFPTRSRRGLGVALIGPDGAGKSTLAAGLAESLVIPTRIVYMGVWRTPRLFALMGAPGRVGHAIVIQWLRWLQGAYHRSRGRFVVFDRYTEVHLEPAPRTERIGRLLQRLRGMAACPPPDLVLLLDAPGTTAFSRKHEQSPEEMERVRQRYLTVADRFPKVAIVDAEDPADKVRRRATDLVWTAYGRRLGS